MRNGIKMFPCTQRICMAVVMQVCLTTFQRGGEKSLETLLQERVDGDKIIFS